MQRVLLLALGLLGGLVACESQFQQIKGSISVMQADGRVVTPGRTLVCLVESTAAGRTLAALRSQCQQLDTELRRTQQECEAVRETRRNLSYSGASFADALRLAEETGNHVAATNAQAELDKLDQERARLSNQELELEKKLAQQEAQKSELIRQAFLKPWPGVLRKTSTDEEGSFAFTIPQNKRVTLVTVCSNATHAQQASFAWFLPVSATNQATLLLNNENLFH